MYHQLCRHSRTVRLGPGKTVALCSLNGLVRTAGRRKRDRIFLKPSICVRIFSLPYPQNLLVRAFRIPRGCSHPNRALSVRFIFPVLQKELDARVSLTERTTAKLKVTLDEDVRKGLQVEEQADLARAALARAVEELSKQRNANIFTQEVGNGRLFLEF